MDFGKLRQFVRNHSTVTAFSSGKELRLQLEDQDIIDLVEKAEQFQYQGKLYSKTEFEKLIAESN